MISGAGTAASCAASLLNERAIVIQPDTPGTARFDLAGLRVVQRPSSKTRRQNVPAETRSRNGRSSPKILHTETKPYLRNAAVPRRFERHSLIDAQRPNSLAGAAGFESLHQGSRPGSRPHPPSAWSRAASRSRSRGCGSPRRGGGRSKGPGDDADLRHRHATSTVRLTICLGPWALKVVHPENHIRT